MADDLVPVNYRPPGDVRDWETLRVAAIAAARDVLGDDELAERVTGAVLAVFDEEALNRLGEHLVNESRIRSMDFRNGGAMDIIPAREAVAGWVGAARAMLDGAPNYSETVMEFAIPEDPQRYAFTVQKVGRLTPHEARRQAEAERDSLRSHIDADHAALLALGRIAQTLARVADNAIQVLEHINMDTDEDRRLHAHAIAAIRAPLDRARGAMQETVADLRRDIGPQAEALETETGDG